MQIVVKTNDFKSVQVDDAKQIRITVNNSDSGYLCYRIDLTQDGRGLVINKIDDNDNAILIKPHVSNEIEIH